MKTKTAVLNGKPDAGNPHVRFDEGEVASAKPRRGSLLYKNVTLSGNPHVRFSEGKVASAKSRRRSLLCTQKIKNKWQMCKSTLAGLVYLYLAVVVGICVIKIDEDGERDFSSMPNYDYIEEVKKLRSESADEAKRLAQYIFETEGMPNQAEARQIYEEIERDQKNWWTRTKRAASGFVTGDGGSIEELGGSVVSDMILYGDIRDLIKHSYFKVTKNEKGDAFILTLSMFGLATEFVDVVDWAPAVLKAFRKAGALSAKMVGLLSDGMKRCMKTKKIDRGLMSLFSEIKSITDSLGFARARRLMCHADDAAEIAALAKAAKMVPDETYLLVKYCGKSGVKELEGLSEAQVKVLREAAKKGPNILKNIKKYGNCLKPKTVTARRFARLIKSWQSGHLTSFIVKLIHAWLFLRFVFGGLALILFVLAGWKFWLVVKRWSFCAQNQ